MKITEKNKVKDLVKLGWIVQCSNYDFIGQIKAFDIPTSLNGIDVLPIEKISLENMLKMWDCNDDTTLLKLTASVFLGINDDKFNELPLIDFLRLTIHLKDTAILAAEQFQSLKRESKNPKIKAIMAGFSGTEFGIIDRFCLRMGMNDHDKAAETPWSIVFMCFREDTMKSDIEEAINETLNSK